MPAATSAALSWPSPKCAANAKPLVTTEIASAVDNEPLGTLRLTRPSSVEPLRSSRNTVTTRRISSSAGGTFGNRKRDSHLGDTALHDGDLLVGIGRQRQHHRVEASAQRGGQIVDAAVAVVGSGDEVEARDRLHLAGQLRHGQGLLAEHRDQRVLHVAGHARELLDANDRAGAHRPVDRAGNERRLAGPSASSRA